MTRRKHEIKESGSRDVIIGHKIYKHPFVAVESATVSADDAMERPKPTRPKPDYLNKYRMSDEELKGYVQNTIDFYEMKAEYGAYTMNVTDLILLELVRRELDRKKEGDGDGTR